MIYIEERLHNFHFVACGSEHRRTYETGALGRGCIPQSVFRVDSTLKFKSTFKMICQGRMCVHFYRAPARKKVHAKMAEKKSLKLVTQDVNVDALCDLLEITAKSRKVSNCMQV